jgi:hypothetical protein
MKAKLLRYCKICGSSNFDGPLRAYSDGSGKLWIYLCYECEAKVLRLTGGEIPLESLSKLGGGFIEEWEWEENRSGNGNNWKLAGRGMDLSRTVIAVFRC